MQERLIDNIGKDDIDKAVTNQKIMIGKVLHLASILGPLVFLAVIWIMSFSPSMAEAVDTSQSNDVEILLWALGVVVVIVLLVSRRIKSMFLRPEVLMGKISPTLESGGKDSVEKAISILIGHTQIMSMVMLALMEAIAFFGLTIILYIQINGSLAQHPLVWLALIPTLIHLVVCIANFPSKNSMVNLVYNQMIRPLVQHWE